MSQTFMAIFFGDQPTATNLQEQMLDPTLVAELNDKLIAIAMIDASSTDLRALWTEVERRIAG